MIVQTITDDYHFWNWLKKSDSYSICFTLEGAKAVQQFFYELSEETDKLIEFDPIAWCCTFSEYESLDAFNNEYFGAEYKKGSEYTLEKLHENTTVIELDNGRILVEEF